MAQRPAIHRTVPGVTFVRELDGISEYRLNKNDLQILLAPNPTTPTVGFMVTYHVGSRNEAIGYTGATHLLEHLMFKGSRDFNKETSTTVWDILETKGALVNATTWNDRTNYFEVVPKDHLKKAIALEADRMRRAHIREKDRQSEMTVVRNEFERGENDPMEALEKQIWALAYEAHPYHHSTIGWRSDIEHVSIARLKQFYDDFYWPDNATVSVVGDIDAKETLAVIVKEFGSYSKKKEAYPLMYTEEPRQEGERRAIVARAGNTDMVGIAHKIPAAVHDDIPALVILSLILADGKASRLFRAIVDTALSTEVSMNCFQFHDPSLIITYTTLVPGIAHSTVEDVIKAVYRKIAEKGVTATELKRAKRAVRAYLASRRDGPYALLSSLNEEIATGDWTRFVTFPKKIAEVNLKMVQMVAKKYLTDDQSTIGWFKAIEQIKSPRTKAKNKKPI
jgi:zinc protease